MSINFKVGRQYRNRLGGVVVVTAIDTKGDYPIACGQVSGKVGHPVYTRRGAYRANGTVSELDLIEEVNSKETFMATHKKMVAWGEDRDIYTESNAQQQASKGLEEFAELVGNVSRITPFDDVTEEEREAVKDDIGDIMACLTHVAYCYGLNLKECYQHSYNEIKDRQGKMVNGKFVKSVQ